MPKNPTSNNNNPPIFQDYDVIEDRTGRGVMLVFKDSLEVKPIEDINRLFSPAIYFNVSNLSTYVNLAITYRSPNSSKEENDKINKQLIQASKSLKDLIIFGDFNYPDIDWENMHCKKKDQHPAQIFLQNIIENNILQHVKEDTHHKPNCKPSLIDLVLSKNTGWSKSRLTLCSLVKCIKTRNLKG